MVFPSDRRGRILGGGGEPSDALLAEDGTTFLVAEDGVTFLTQES
jgi:hypothetical protein